MHSIRVIHQIIQKVVIDLKLFLITIYDTINTNPILIILKK